MADYITLVPCKLWAWRWIMTLLTWPVNLMHNAVCVDSMCWVYLFIALSIGGEWRLGLPDVDKQLSTWPIKKITSTWKAVLTFHLDSTLIGWLCLQRQGTSLLSMARQNQLLATQFTADRTHGLPRNKFGSMANNLY